ncbi:MAG TPA: hypothetical protein VJM82_02795 [Nitrospiraceae bacterium]|nr:hypothetical protein [Nitrospiraceae bacterium]
MATAVGFPAKDLKEENLTAWRHLASETRCSRCKGLMVIEQCFDFMDDTGRLDFWARRCVQCGEVIDPVIVWNRRQRLPGGIAAGPVGSGVLRSKERS